MRPVTDSHQISRAKLAYIIDATAAPICIIAPISSWAAAVTGFVESEDGELQVRIKEIQDTIDKRKENKDTYDDSIVRQMVECIKVYHDGRLQIILGGGYELEEYLEK